jgi:hypothetical protein
MNKKIIMAIGGLIVVAAIALPNLFRKNSSDKSLKTDNTQKEISIDNNICTEFPKEFIATALGKNIIKTTAQNSQTTSVCQYFIDENNFVTLRLNNLNVEDQKKGQINLDRTISTNDQIKMEHFVVLQENGLINGIYLVLNPNLFIAVDRTSAKAASEEEIIAFAAKVAERIKSGEKAEIKLQPSPTNQPDVPLPQQEDIVRNFFNLINEDKITEAVDMLSPEVISDESQKQAWGVQFNAFKKLIVKKIEPAGESNYKVTLDVEMKPEAANTIIPFYGYENGDNIRWIGLVKVDNLWRITGIATGP